MDKYAKLDKMCSIIGYKETSHDASYMKSKKFGEPSPSKDSLSAKENKKHLDKGIENKRNHTTEPSLKPPSNPTPLSRHSDRSNGINRSNV